MRLYLIVICGLAFVLVGCGASEAALRATTALSAPTPTRRSTTTPTPTRIPTETPTNVPTATPTPSPEPTQALAALRTAADDLVFPSEYTFAGPVIPLLAELRTAVQGARDAMNFERESEALPYLDQAERIATEMLALTPPPGQRSLSTVWGNVVDDCPEFIAAAREALMMRDEVAMHTVRTEYSWCVLALNNILRELEEWLDVTPEVPRRGHQASEYGFIITYAVYGSAETATLTTRNDTNGTETHSVVTLPYEQQYLGFGRGDLVSIVAANDGDTGTLVCRIDVFGVSDGILARAESNEPYGTVRCDGRVQ